jgi:tetratricopeptide (TPR) repeat protein
MSDAPNTQDIAESHLSELIEKDATDWENRKKLAQLLYNEGKTKEAANVVWEAPEIPAIDLELGFAIKILGKGAPRKAIRLLTGIQELNKGKAVQNLGLANALMHYGMVMQAARFYGAALAEDQSLASADLEHFLLWTDDKEKIWGNFNEEKPTLGELPWMKRDAKEAEQLKKAMKGHTTPIKIPNLDEVTAENIVIEMYVQSSRVASDPTPPPAVTIPIERVDPKHIVIDSERGAGQPITVAQAQAAMGPTGESTGQPLPAAANTPSATTPEKSPPIIPAVVKESISLLVPQPAPTQMIIGGAAGPVSTQSLHDAPPPMMKPVKTPSLVGGKIVVGKPTPSEEDK